MLTLLPIHTNWFVLFLHPLCQKLVISSTSHSWSLKDALTIALGIAKRYNWAEAIASNLAKDIKGYYLGHAPFADGKANRKSWWEDLTLASASLHPLKVMAIKIFSIIPHTAEVELLFSSLGGHISLK